MNEQRRIYKPEEKLKIVLEGLNGTIQISDLCKKYNIQTSRFYDWKDKVLKSASNIFEDRGRKSTADQRVNEDLKKENQRLKETIAEIVSENLEIKKRLETTGRRYEISIS
ncbi:Transposase IS3/IS911 [mine drainage metagenome]|uniref:Transposase IS3/IS911 n=2 Tax=mine drainage metagenome TaxID=410659 RepID=T1C450_9ZZZZ